MGRQLLLFSAVFLGLGLANPRQAVAQAGPSSFSFDGTLLNSDGTPVTQSSVAVKLELLDKNSTCVLYSEVHTGLDLSNTKGTFSVVVGAGSQQINSLEGGTSFDSKLFLNTGSTGPFANCSPGVTLNPGDGRQLRVSYDLNQSGVYAALTPNFPVGSVPYAMVADSVGGKSATDFLQTDVNSSLNQTNAEYVFSLTNWPKLKAMVDGTSTQFLPATPTAALDFNGQRVSNLANPTSAQDAVSKSYDDSNLGGKAIDVSGVGPGVGNGSTLVWDSVNNKWTATTVSGTGITGLVGDVVASGSGTVSAMISNNAITSAKINTTGIGMNRLLMTDNISGSTVGYATCSMGQVLQWNSMGWTCANMSAGGWLNGGNSFGMPANLGTTDSFPMNFVTSGVPRMTLDPTGRVGIGTTAPMVTLDMTNETDGVSLPKGTTTQQPVSPQFGTTRYNTDQNTVETYTWPGQWESQTHKYNARWGFGTAAPNSLFEIQAGGLNQNPSLSFGSTLAVDAVPFTDAQTPASGTSTGTAFVTLSGSTVGAMNTGVTTTNADTVLITGAPMVGTNQSVTNSTALYIQGNGLSSAVNKAYGLNVNAPTGAIQNYAAVFNGGNVGVGTTAPTAALEIDTTSVSAKGLVVKGVAGQAGNLQEWQNSSGAAIASLSPSGTFLVGGGGTPSAPTYGVGLATIGFFAPGGNALGFALGGAERARFDPTGNFGIGTTAPGAKLDVAGHVANSGPAATVTSCGTSPTIIGNDTRGTVTVGSASPTSCSIVFNSPYNTPPVCVVTWGSATPPTMTMSVVPAVGTLNVYFQSTASGMVFNYICMQ